MARLVQPLLDQSRILVIMTSNWDGQTNLLEASFRDRIQISHQMIMTDQLRNQILDRELSKVCPHLEVPLPVRQELLKTARKSIRKMIDIMTVSAARSIEDNYNILVLYPLV